MKKRKIILLIFLIILILGTILLVINKDKIINYYQNKNLCIFDSKDNLKNQVPVIMYHYIADYGTDVSKLDDGTIISADAFEEQMKYLYDNGYKSLTLTEYIEWKKGKDIGEKRFMITFDDGFTSTYNLAEPILKKYGFTGVQFVINELLADKTPTFEEQRYAYMGYDYIENYSRETIEIGSHSYEMHHQLPKIYAKVNGMTYDEIYNDITKSKEELNATCISYPYGAYTEDLLKAVKDAGYECGFALNGTKTYQKEDIYASSRISATENFEIFKKIFETDKYERKVCKLF